MMTDVAIFAGRGILPRLINRAHPEALVVSFQNVGIDFCPDNHFEAQFEKSGRIFFELKSRGIQKICFAGAIIRPKLNPLRLDAKTALLLPRIRAAIASSDGGALGIIRQLVETEGYQVIGAHRLCPDFIAQPGVLTQTKPGAVNLERTREIHRAISAIDLGQGLVMRDRQCLAVETQPGTEAMLKFAADQPGSGGYLFKTSKPGQDLDMDMATIGPDTITQILDARLDGIYIESERVLLVDRVNLIKQADQANVFIEALPCG